MKAVQYRSIGAAAELVSVAEPTAGPGQVVLDVLAAGLCHSDLAVMDWPADKLPYRLPMTLGHESTGRVASVGDGVSTVEVGDLVAVYGPWGCGVCWSCAQGKENYCTRAAALGVRPPGLGRDGALAEQLLVDDARHLVPLDGLDPVEAVSLTDAGLTPYHAIKAALPVMTPGSTAVVIGAGGLGHVAIQLLRALTPARVVALDISEEKLLDARALGAHEVLVSDADAAGALRDLTGRDGAQAVFDFVGSQATIDIAAGSAGTEAHVAVVGIGGGSLPVSFASIAFGTSVRCPYWGSRSELVEVLALARAGVIEVHHELYAIEEAPAAYERLRSGEVKGRAVVVPGG